MKIVLPSILIFTIVLIFWGCDGHIGSKEKKVAFEKQWETFKQLGFTLNDGVVMEDIVRTQGGRNAFEENSYSLMYQTLGQAKDKEPWTPFTNNCWYLDLESIEGNGSYVRIMENISRITHGELRFDSLRDYVDIDEGKVWVAFVCNGDSYHWDLERNDDWADGHLFDKVQDLTTKYKTKGKFTFFNTGEQCFTLGYHTSKELHFLRKATGLNIVRLRAKGQIY